MSWRGSGGGGGSDGAFADLREGQRRALPRIVLGYGRGQLPQFVVGAVASVVAMLMELVPAYILMVGIDSLFFDERAFGLPLVPAAWLPAHRAGQFGLLVGLLGTAYVLGAVMGWVNSWAWNHFAQHLQHAVRVDTYDAMQRREMEFFDTKQTGEVMSILNNDVNQLESFLTSSLTTGLTILVRVGGMGAVMLLINWRLGIIPAVVIPVLGYASYWFVAAIQPKYGRVRASVGALNSRLENNIGGIEVVKSHVTEAFETDRVAAASGDYLDANWDAITTRIKFWPALQLITAGGYLAVFVVGGWWVVFGSPHPFFRGTMTAGTLVLFLSYSQRFMWPMRQFGRVVNDYQYAEAAAQRVVGLLDRTPAVRDSPDAVDLEVVEGHVEYEGVSFCYQNESGHRESALEDVSFAAEPGDYVGLVGPTGAGKTTAMKLLMRLYDVTEGAIRVDGHDVRNVTLESLRRHVGYVSQEPYLFYGTVRENIAYGIAGVDDADVRAAAEQAGAHEFVSELPDGYDTMVGERGVKLSGGQRQRISIARAVLRDPELLVLDEATSHVDNETEVVIQRNLADLVADRTTFAIAHRLSTVRNADRILVFDGGRVVESGTHDELIEAGGLYANLWSVQVGEVEDLPEEFVARAARRADD